MLVIVIRALLMLWPLMQNGDLHFIFKLIRYWFIWLFMKAIWFHTRWTWIVPSTNFFAFFFSAYACYQKTHTVQTFSFYLLLINLNYFCVNMLSNVAAVKYKRLKNINKWHTHKFDRYYTGFECCIRIKQ